MVTTCRWSCRGEEWWKRAGGHGVERRWRGVVSGGSVQVVVRGVKSSGNEWWHRAGGHGVVRSGGSVQDRVA